MHSEIGKLFSNHSDQELGNYLSTIAIMPLQHPHALESPQGERPTNGGYHSDILYITYISNNVRMP
jgi:hypothetical protein